MSFPERIFLSRTNVFVSTILFFLSAPFFASAAINYTRVAPGVVIQSPFTVTVSVDSFSDYGFTPGVNLYYITLDDDYNPHTECFPSTQLEANASFDVPDGDPVKGVMIVGFTNFCESGDEPYYLEGDGMSTAFTVTGFSSSDPVIASGGTLAYRPEVTVTSPRGENYFSSAVPVEYSSLDKNDEGTVGGHPFGLSTTPVSVYYSDHILDWNHTIIDPADKTPIVSQLPPSGSYTWKIGDLTPGNFYRIIVDAIDKVGEIGEDVSDLFTIDLALPTFVVKASPSVVTELGKVTISVDPSEALREPPTLSVTQRGGKEVAVPTRWNGNVWEGIYDVLPGFDGTAVVSVSGVDRAGNRGETILSGGSFNIGVKPPPPPYIATPQNNSVAASETIDVRGTSRDDTEIILTQNGTLSYSAKLGADLAFVVSNIKLNKTISHGENILSVVARDRIGIESEPVVLRVSLNTKPSVLLERPAAQSVLSGTSTLLSAKVSDENKDPVLLRYEMLPLVSSGVSGGENAEWFSLGETVSGKLLIDTTELLDGQYLLRAVGSDGATTTTSSTRNVSVNNQLPSIRFDDGRRTVVPRGFATVRGSVFAPDIPGSRPTITGLEYSLDRGKKWSALVASDGTYNSFEERFAATIAFSEPAEGMHEILWRATDSRGFRVVTSHPVVVDTVPPKAPVVLFPENGSFLTKETDEDPRKEGLQFTARGKAEPRSIVTVTLAGRSFTTEASFDDGTWKQALDISERGEYEVTAALTDAAGNKSGKTSVEITYNTPPQIVFLSPKEGGGVHGSFLVQYLIKDPDGDWIRHDQVSYGRAGGAPVFIIGDLGENSFLWGTTKLATGKDYYLRIDASDGVATSTETILISVDNGVPTIDAFSVQRTSFAKNGVLMASGSASDDLSGVEFVEYAILKEGEEFLVPIPYGMMEKTKERELEKKAEEMAARWQKGSIVSGSLSKKATWSIKEPLRIDDGAHRLFVRVVDASGNVSAAKEEHFVIDSTPPRFGSLSLSYRKGAIFPVGGRFTVPAGASVAALVSLEGDATKAEISLVGDRSVALERDNASGLWKGEMTFPEVGETSVTIIATDKAGNAGEEKDVALITVVPPGKITYREGSELLPAGRKTVGVLVHDPARDSYSSWKGASSLYGDTVDLADGAYILALPRGTYRLVVSGPSLTEESTEPFTLSEAQFVTVDLTLDKVKKESFWSIIKAWFKKKFSQE